MKAISIEVGISKINKIEAYIQKINTDDDLVACSVGMGVIYVSAVDECSIMRAYVVAKTMFGNRMLVIKIK